MSERQSPYEVKVDSGSHFAWMRTQMAMQRTLMAAVRTAVSLIGFGFTVAQFFQKLKVNAVEGLPTMKEEAPRNFGLLLIAAGVVSLAIFTWQYYLANRYMRSGSFAVLSDTQGKTLRSPSYIVSFAVMLIGIAAFVMILLRF